jgi:outer membrane protein W
MNRKMGIAFAAFAFASAGASIASAQTAYRGDVDQPGNMRAPVGAIELQLNTGYAQTFGPNVDVNLAPDRDITGGGIGAGLGLAYRANPFFSVGLTGGYSQAGGMDEEASLRGANVGLDVTVHTTPYSRLDPYISVGSGYKMAWSSAARRDDIMFHGFQIARLNVGLDVRVNDSIAVAPTIGGDLSTFMWRSEDGGDIERIENVRLNPGVFAGINGRFDLGGARVREVPRTAVVTAKR